MRRIKVGDRVRHEAGWLATVTHKDQGHLTITVTADDPKLSGVYSSLMFELEDEED